MIDRQAAVSIIADQMKALSEEGYELAVSGGNMYTWASASLIRDVSLTSSMDNLFDESVPFYQMVLHGYIPYFSEPLNQVSNYEVTVLKLIETGTNPSFLWMYKDNTVLKGTDYSSYYSVNYAYWIDKAAALYAELNEVLGDCVTSNIVSHDRPSEEVCRTIYDNGVCIYVNYGTEDATVDGVIVPTLGYKRVKGEAR